MRGLTEVEYALLLEGCDCDYGCDEGAVSDEEDALLDRLEERGLIAQFECSCSCCELEHWTWATLSLGREAMRIYEAMHAIEGRAA